jgi:hypothetical protein
MKKVKGFVLGLVIIMIFLATGVALATDTYSGSGTLQTWAIGDLGTSGTPFWNNASSDGAQRNIGYYLSNTGFFAGGTAGPGAIQYYGNGPAAVNSFSFGHLGGGDSAAMKLEIAGNAGSNAFGWFDTTIPFSPHQLFAGGNVAGDAAIFTPTASYAFYLQGPGGTFLTTTAGDQFAVFQEAGSGPYWIGMEDIGLRNGSDKDYNDMVVKIAGTAVPEPMTLLFLGGCLLGTGIISRKFKK